MNNKSIRLAYAVNHDGHFELKHLGDAVKAGRLDHIWPVRLQLTYIII
jgi:hypothetical protein